MRAADTLLFLADERGETTKHSIEIFDLPHRELSSISKLARETIICSLTELEKSLNYWEHTIFCTLVTWASPEKSCFARFPRFQKIIFYSNQIF